MLVDCDGVTHHISDVYIWVYLNISVKFIKREFLIITDMMRLPSYMYVVTDTMFDYLCQALGKHLHNEKMYQ